MSLIQDVIRTYLPSQKVGHNGWISFNCPVCLSNGQPRPDTKHRGGVQFPDGDSVRYSCFNCHFKTGWQKGQHFSGRFKQLLKGIGMPEIEVQRLTLELLREQEALSFITPVAVVREIYSPTWKPVALPENSRPLQDCLTDPRAVRIAEYLHSRNLLDKTNWMWSDSTDFEIFNRAILPLTYKGKVVGWHARLAEEGVKHPRRKIVKKHDTDYIYGLDSQHPDRKFVIIVEGQYDALAISGLSVGTNRISQNQADVINALGREVIVVPDKDRAGRDLEEDAIRYGWAVSFPTWERGVKDVAKAVELYGSLFVLKNIIEHRQTNKIKLTILGKKYYE